MHTECGIPSVNAIMNGYNATIFAYGQVRCRTAISPSARAGVAEPPPPHTHTHTPQTGSGKTFTMHGGEGLPGTDALPAGVPCFCALRPVCALRDPGFARAVCAEALVGLVHRVTTSLFAAIHASPLDTEYLLRCSYVEFYNESVRACTCVPLPRSAPSHAGS